MLKAIKYALREIVAHAVQTGIPVPCFSAALAYYDSYRTATLPANLLQAQRDYFGAHTYQRTDREGIFHTNGFKNSNNEKTLCIWCKEFLYEGYYQDSTSRSVIGHQKNPSLANNMSLSFGPECT